MTRNYIGEEKSGEEERLGTYRRGKIPRIVLCDRFREVFNSANSDEEQQHNIKSTLATKAKYFKVEKFSPKAR